MKTPLLMLALIVLSQGSIPANPISGAAHPQQSSPESQFRIAETIPVPAFEKKSFLNSMDLVLLRSDRKRFPFVLMIMNGAAFDPAGKWGLTYLTIHSLLTANPVTEQPSLFESLERLGTDLRVHVARDAVYFIGESPATRLEESLALLADRITQPQFESESFDSLRRTVQQEIKTELQQQEAWSEQLFRAQLFGGNPYAHPVKGTPQTIARVTLADVKIQYRKLFLPNQAQLATYHDRDPNALFDDLSSYWGVWTRDSAVPFTFQKAGSTPLNPVLIRDSSTPSGHVRWGILVPAKGSRSYYAVKILEQYLKIAVPTWTGSNDSGDLNISVELRAQMMPGYLQVRMSAPPEQLFPAFQKFNRQLDKVVQGEVDPSTFEWARRSALQEFRKQLADPQALLDILLNTRLYSLGVGYIANYGRRLNRVNLRRFQTTLKELLTPARHLTVISGPNQLIQQQLGPFPDALILN